MTEPTDTSMTKAQLLEIELQRRIDNFQKAVSAFTLSETIENAHRLAVAKTNLSSFMVEGKS